MSIALKRTCECEKCTCKTEKPQLKRIVCLWGGPGTGKSTTATGIFNILKKKGYNCELNREYVKDWVWEGRKILPGDQVYLTAKQARKEVLFMRQNLDFIITDSPLALSNYYGNVYDKYEQQVQATKKMIEQHHLICKDLGYKIDHFFLVRQKKYNPAGRLQTEEEAKNIDVQLRKFLDEYPINYQVLDCDEEIENTIVNILLNEKIKT